MNRKEDEDSKTLDNVTVQSILAVQWKLFLMFLIWKRRGEEDTYRTLIVYTIGHLDL